MKDEQGRAGSAHEMVMMNLAVFHLLLPVAALSSGYLSVFLSIALIGYLGCYINHINKIKLPWCWLIGN